MLAEFAIRTILPKPCSQTSMNAATFPDEAEETMVIAATKIVKTATVADILVVANIFQRGSYQPILIRGMTVSRRLDRLSRPSDAETIMHNVSSGLTDKFVCSVSNLRCLATVCERTCRLCTALVPCPLVCPLVRSPVALRAANGQFWPENLGLCNENVSGRFRPVELGSFVLRNLSGRCRLIRLSTLAVTVLSLSNSWGSIRWQIISTYTHGVMAKRKAMPQ